MGRGARKVTFGLALLAVVIASLNLRAGVSSVGTVLGDILADLGGSGTTAGIITALPGAFFAIMGLAAVPMAKKLGLSGTLVAGMVLTLVGLAVRPWVGGIGAFLVLTALVVAGIAVMNVLLPAWIKTHSSVAHMVTLMTVYSAVLGVSGALGPLSALVFEDTEGGWRNNLFVWALPALAQLLVWIVVLAKVGHDFPSGQSPAQASDHSGPETLLWRSKTAIFLMLFFGFQSMNAYVAIGWFPQILVDSGASLATASIGLSVIMALGILGGLVMPTIIARSRHLPWYGVAFGALLIVGHAGLILAPSQAPLLWALFLGLSGFAFPMALALIPARTRLPLVTARASGFVQPFGYIIAAIGPLAVGMAYAALGSWPPILMALAATGVVMMYTGFKAAQPTYIDDELVAAS